MDKNLKLIAAGTSRGTDSQFSYSSDSSRITRIQQELGSKEKILWTGVPDANRSMSQGFAIWLFAIPWTVFAVFWETSVCFIPGSLDPTRFVFIIFGVPFVLVGFGMLLSPYFARKKASNTLYVITDCRVLIAEFSKNFTVRSYLPAELGRVCRTDLDHSKSDLSFLINVDSEGGVSYSGFTGVADGRSAEQFLNQLKQKDSASKSAPALLIS